MSSSHNKNTKKIIGWDVKESVKISDPDSNKRVSFNQEEFDRAVTQQGSRVRVYRTVFCPNVKSIDGSEHDIDCQVPGCNNGFLDVHPISTYAHIKNQNLDKYHNIEGMVDGNSVTATFLLGVELQYFNLVELCDYTDIYFQRVKRSQGDIDVLKYTCKRVNVLIDQNGVEYYQAIDFKLDPNGNVWWCSGKGPDPSVIYSIHYEAAVQFRAIKALHVNRFIQAKDPNDGGKVAFMKMQEEWLLQKEFFVKRKDIDGNEILPNLISDPDED